MFPVRPTATFGSVSRFDPSFAELDMALQKNYLLTRDMEELGDLSKLPQPLGIFWLRPMLTRYQHLEGSFDLLFQFHVEKIDGFSDSDWEPIPKDPDGHKRLTDKALERIPREIVIEQGAVVWESASRDGKISPFSLPGTLQALGARAREVGMLTAVRAAMANAAELTD